MGIVTKGLARLSKAKGIGLKVLMTAGLAGAFSAAAAAQEAASSDWLASSRQDALQALAILGADVPGSSRRCASCHEMSVTTFERWRDQALAAQSGCFRGNPSDPSSPLPTPMQRIDCMRENPSNPASPFKASRLGVYAAGAHTSQLKDLFQAAYPADVWQARYDGFAAAVQMPMGGTPMTAPEFDFVLGWTLEGMPYLTDILSGPGPAPTTCTTEIKPALVAHLRRMQTEGWAAKNRDAGLVSFGCAPGADAMTCFTLKDDQGSDLFPQAAATPFGTGWERDMPGSTIRVLRDLNFRTNYWMRSSIDGRFVANGASGTEGDGDDRDDSDNRDSLDGEGDGPQARWGGMVSDLAPQLNRGAPFRDIKVDATYDPSFFPDGSGFVFQGTSVGTGFCRMSILENTATSTIDWRAAECSRGSISLYQAVGASLDGSDYMAITGTFSGDGGGGRTGGDGSPTWGSESRLVVTPIVNDGQAYKTLASVQVQAPWQGDWGLASSNLMTAARIAGTANGRSRQQGYRFSFLERTATPTGYTVALKNAGTICQDGNKGVFSYDDRMFTVYHYVDSDDWKELGFADAEAPEFKEMLRKGAANVYVMDLMTGLSQRVTRMNPGQFAQFPHFRSDGWIYFMVYDQNTGKRHVAATDAGILIGRRAE